MASVVKKALDQLKGEIHPKKQKYSYFSVRFFKNEIDGIYGFICPRGTAPDDVVGEMMENKLIGQMHEEYLFVCNTGQWTFLTSRKDKADAGQRFVEKDEAEAASSKTGEKDVQTLFDKSINPIGDLNEEATNIERRRNELRTESERESEMSLEERHDTLKHYVDKRNKKIQVTRLLETWGQQKRNMLSAIKETTKEITRLEQIHSDYPERYEEYMAKEKERMGLAPSTPLDRPSIQRAIPRQSEPSGGGSTSSNSSN